MFIKACNCLCKKDSLMISGIIAASHEQSEGIGKVTQAIT
jgi:hypothetical protein